MRTTVCCRLLALTCLAALFRAIPACAPAPVARCAPLVCVPVSQQQAQPPHPPPQPAGAEMNRRSGLPVPPARAAGPPSTGLGPAIAPHCGALSAALGGTNPLLPGLVPLPAHELASITAAVIVTGLVAAYRYVTPAGSGSRAGRLRRRQQQPQQSGLLRAAAHWLGGCQLASRIPDWRRFHRFLQCVLLVGAPVAGFLWPHMQWAVILAVVAQQAVYFLVGSTLALAVAALHSLGLGIASGSHWLLYGEAPMLAADQPAAAAAHTQRQSGPASATRSAPAAANASSGKARSRSSKSAPARTLSAPIASSNDAPGEAASTAAAATRSSPASSTPAAVRRGRSLPSGFKVGTKQAAAGTAKQQQSPRVSSPDSASSAAGTVAPTTPPACPASAPKEATPSAAAKQLRVSTPAAQPAAQGPAPAATAPAAPKTVRVPSSSSPRGGSSPQPITPTTPKQLPTANPFAPARRQQGKVAAAAPAAHGPRPAARDVPAAEGKQQPQAPRGPAQPQQPAPRQLHICTTECSREPAPAVPAAPVPAAAKAKAPLQPPAMSALAPPTTVVPETRPLPARAKTKSTPVAAVDSPAYSLFSDAASPLEAALAQAAAAAAAGAAAAGRPASPGTPFLDSHPMSAFAVQQQQPCLLQPAVQWGHAPGHVPAPQLQAFVHGSWQRPPQQQLWQQQQQQQQLWDDERGAEQPPGWESMLLELLADDGEAPVQLPSFSSVAGYSI